MDYTQFNNAISDLSEQIQNCKDDGILDINRILNYLKIIKAIPNEIKELLITKPLLINACIKSIYKRVESYTNQYLYDEIIDKLRKKEISTSYNLDIIYKKIITY